MGVHRRGGHRGHTNTGQMPALCPPLPVPGVPAFAPRFSCSLASPSLLSPLREREKKQGTVGVPKGLGGTGYPKLYRSPPPPELWGELGGLQDMGGRGVT